MPRAWLMAMLLRKRTVHRTRTCNMPTPARLHGASLKFYTFMIMAGTEWLQWLLAPFSTVSCDNKSDKNNSLRQKQQPDEANPTDMGLIVKFLMKMQAYLIRVPSTTPAGNKIAVEVDGPQTPPKSSSHRKSFRNMTICEYENRLRVYSRPEKIFNYFATIKTRNKDGVWEQFMTPNDFLRSMMPGFRQPENLGLNKFQKMKRIKTTSLKYKGIDKDSIFYKFRPDGLLTYEDYLYLLVLMPLPERYFEIGFTLFDTQGNGSLSLEEFDQLLLGFKKDDHLKFNSCVIHYLFGPELNEKLSLTKFIEFRRQFQHEIRQLQFYLLLKRGKPTVDKTVSGSSFAKFLLTYSAMTKQEKREILRRIRVKYRECKSGITLQEFMNFFKFVDELPTIDCALVFHYFSGANISKETLKYVSEKHGVPLTPYVIDIIFTVFDYHQRGLLEREFIEIMRHRMSRSHRRTIKLSKLFKIVTNCAKRTLLGM